MSSAISWAQPTSPAGSGLASPFWFTLRKQPLQGGSPVWLRYESRSDWAFGWSYASTIATTWLLPFLSGSLDMLNAVSPYTSWSWLGTRFVAGLGARGLPPRSVRRQEWQRAIS